MGSLERLISDAMEASKAVIHTSQPGYVLDYDRASQKARIQLIVRGRQVDPNDPERLENYRFPPLENVLVRWPSSSAGSLTHDLARGDVVMVHFCERSISEWRQNGGDDVTPLDPRRFDLTDAYAEPGGRPFSSPLGSDAYAAGAFVVKGDDVRLGGAEGTNLIALANLCNDNFTEIKQTIEQLLIALNAALVPQTPSGASAITFTAPLPSAPNVPSVAATQVRAK